MIGATMLVSHWALCAGEMPPALAEKPSAPRVVFAPSSYHPLINRTVPLVTLARNQYRPRDGSAADAMPPSVAPLVDMADPTCVHVPAFPTVAYSSTNEPPPVCWT